jgi:hypothetical protein
VGSGRRQRGGVRLSQELALVEGGVHAFALHQIGVATLLYESPLVEHQDAVGRENGRQAVGDHERFAAGEERTQGCLNQLF